MRTKEIKINVPEGYEIDKENSTFECIKFKSKEDISNLTYEWVMDSSSIGGTKVFTHIR